MTRGAFKMKLYKGFEDEYKKRHDEIWPELKKTLSDAGISDYSIYLDEETGTLFGFRKVSEDNTDRKSTRLNSSHIPLSRMPSSA